MLGNMQRTERYTSLHAQNSQCTAVVADPKELKDITSLIESLGRTQRKDHGGSEIYRIELLTRFSNSTTDTDLAVGSPRAERASACMQLPRASLLTQLYRCTLTPARTAQSPCSAR